MITLEDVATGKRCPIMKSGCIGSQCMMWKTVAVEPLLKKRSVGDPVLLPDCQFNTDDTIDAIHRVLESLMGENEHDDYRITGYCGLAGKGF